MGRLPAGAAALRTYAAELCRRTAAAEGPLSAGHAQALLGRGRERLRPSLGCKSGGGAVTGIQPTTTAAAIACGLIDDAQHSTGHRRLFLRDYLSISPAAVFAALEPSLTHEVTVGADTPRPMAAVPAGNALLI